MAKTGRKSIFAQELADEICQRIAEGESLSKICGPERRPGMPHRQTVYVWLADNPAFRKDYHSARELQGHLLFEQIVEIADARDSDAVLPRDVSRDRLRVDVRRHAAARLAPREYGDRLATADEIEDDPDWLVQEDAMAARIAAILEAVRVRRDEQ